jgi:hypothetical protein
VNDNTTSIYAFAPFRLPSDDASLMASSVVFNAFVFDKKESHTRLN